MLTIIFCTVVGVLIGWNLPQPEFAKRWQAWIVEKGRGWFR